MTDKCQIAGRCKYYNEEDAMCNEHKGKFGWGDEDCGILKNNTKFRLDEMK